MHETMLDCGCRGSCCCETLPAEFVRVRYYFGQRLGVMELSDQYLYHAGKMAFHNARQHGFGVLCGLRAEKQKPPAGTASTVLRVSVGAAIDPCGREIAVGIDQCIDVAAWFAKNKARPELAGWTAGKTPRLRVAIRYRECPSDPSPAPRDPCGCDNGGCEFGRVRESFEMALFTDDEKVCAGAPFPAAADLLAAFAGGGSAADDPTTAINRKLDALVAAGCPVCSDDLWLCLASFTVTLDATPVPVDLSSPDNTIHERRTLLPTHALQTMVLDLVGEGSPSGAIGTGPRAGGLSFTADAVNKTTAGTLLLGVSLAAGGSPPVPIPLVDKTFDPAFVTIEVLNALTGWKDITPTAANITYEAAAVPPDVKIVFAQDLADGPVFRLTIDPPFTRPVVDQNGYPLPRVARTFRFVLDAGKLVLAPSV
jgi:hypothetical protein